MFFLALKFACSIRLVYLVLIRISGIDSSSTESLKPFYLCFHFQLNRASGVEVEYMDLDPGLCPRKTKAPPPSAKPRPHI
jgi:hypothetical protein